MKRSLMRNLLFFIFKEGLIRLIKLNFNFRSFSTATVSTVIFNLN